VIGSPVTGSPVTGSLAGGEATPARRALAVVTLAVALFASVVLQLTAVNRLPLPGGSAPDLVLLLVTAIAVVSAPVLGAVTGFAAGLAVDIAPPAAHYAGEYALVFCLAGYGAARVGGAVANSEGDRDPVTAFTIMTVAAAAGEAGKAGLGLLLSDPDVTTAAVSRVLPAAVLADLLLAPLVCWLVVRVTRGVVSWNTAPGRGPAPEFSREQRLARVLRPASAGAAPGLHLAGSGAAYGHRAPARPLPSIQFSGAGKNYEKPSVAGRVPKLRLSGSRGGAIFRTVPGSAGIPRSPLTAGRARKVNFAGDLPLRARARPARAVRSPGKNWLAAAGAGLPGRPGPAGRKSARPRKFANSAARAGAVPIAPRVPRTAAEALAARSAPSGLSALAGAGTPLARRRSARAGWLGGVRPFRRRRTPGGTWYAASPSGAWPRRGRHPWRNRSQRLLRMMGVTK
jgi:rod shape-determining protein MreD